MDAWRATATDEGGSDTVRSAIIIPCYNDGGTLLDALASLEGQEPAEIVVIDDGSTDPLTLETLEQVRARGVLVLRQENRGPSAARMAGVAATSARYVLPLDADDELLPAALERLGDALDADPDAALAWGDTELFGAATGRIRNARTLDPWLLTYVNGVAGRSLIRRDRLLAAGGWQLRRGYEDWDLWLAFSERDWKGVHVGRITSRYRVGPGLWVEDFARHGEAVAQLRARHAPLFAERHRNWRRSPSAWRLKLLLPLIGLAPLSPRNAHRLGHLVWTPKSVLWHQRRRIPRLGSKKRGAAV